MTSRYRLAAALQCAIFLCFVLLAPLLVPPPVSDAGNEIGLSRLAAIQSISKAAPEYVLVGNSMLGSRIDFDTLEELSGSPFYQLRRNGSGTGVWYLFLKNLLAKSEARPKLVVVFFRDIRLSEPDHKLTGKDFQYLKSLMLREEPEFFQVLPHMREADGLDPTTRFVRWLYPVANGRARMRDKMSSLALDVTAFGTSKNLRRQQMNELFATGLLRAEAGINPDNDQPEQDPKKKMPFDCSPEASFLPHMLAVAKEQQFQLCFYRVKRRPKLGKDRIDTPSTAAYMTDLRHYLESNNAIFLDESTDPRMTSEWYAEGDHIAKDRMEEFTKLFWERIRPHVQ